MSTTLRLTAEEYDSMIAKGAFHGLQRRIELIRGELREMNPAGPVHEDYIDFLNRWSASSTQADQCVIRVQSSIDLGDSRPEPDITWLKPGRYAARRPQAADVLLVIEVADTSLAEDIGEKAKLYAEFKLAEYWVVDTTGQRILVHRESDGDRYMSVTEVSGNQTLAPRCQPSANLILPDLFADG